MLCTHRRCALSAVISAMAGIQVVDPTLSKGETPLSHLFAATFLCHAPHACPLPTCIYAHVPACLLACSLCASCTCGPSRSNTCTQARCLNRPLLHCRRGGGRQLCGAAGAICGAALWHSAPWHRLLARSHRLVPLQRRRGHLRHCSVRCTSLSLQLRGPRECLAVRCIPRPVCGDVGVHA